MSEGGRQDGSVTHDYDVIIIGGGPVGEHAAGRASRANLKTAVVENELVGGECSYWACMPSKTLIRPSQVLAAARNVPGAAAAVTGMIDVQAALARRDWMVSDWSDAGQVEWLQAAHVDLFRGRGRIKDAHLVSVDQSDGTSIDLHARLAVVLATGSDSFVPPIDGLDHVRAWSNRDATSAKQVPTRLLVLGGGAVGVELAQAWRRLGSASVSIIEASDRLLAREEPFVSDIVRDALVADGIEVVLGTSVVSVHQPAADAPITVILSDGRSLVGDELLVAVGRRPRRAGLGLEGVGVDPNHLEVDEHMAVKMADGTGPWLYAVGDVSGHAQLTHMGKYQARLAVDAIAGHPRADVADERAVSRVVFSDPQVASVGLTESEALEQGFAVAVVTSKTSAPAAAAIIGEKVLGSCQLVIDKKQSVIVGATFVGPDMGEMLHAATIAIVGAVPMETLAHAVPAFPTMSEIWLELVEAYLIS